MHLQAFHSYLGVDVSFKVTLVIRVYGWNRSCDHCHVFANIED